MTRNIPRVDSSGRAYAGSQRQIQTYVNLYQDELSESILCAMPEFKSLNARFHWTSPLKEDGFREYRDKEFLRSVGLEHFYPELREFWPRNGPVWDALAIVESETDLEFRGILLVEAKSYPNEVYGNGCQASSRRSIEKIETAFGRTKGWLNVPLSCDWKGPLYQSANRIAHLYFLGESIKVDTLVGQPVLYLRSALPNCTYGMAKRSCRD